MSQQVRLLDSFIPSHYAIKLDVSREEKRFTGCVVIDGEAKTPTFKLNQKYLSISRVCIDECECAFEVSDESETVTIFGPKTGSVRVEIEYSAPLTDTMMGIYPSYYLHNGEKKQLIGTQFETTFAREAFVCVDEPCAKATFDLALKFDEKPGEIALSNQNEIACKDGYHIFDTTVKMSTYLLAFVCGDLQHKTAYTSSGVEVGVFATRAHQPHVLDLALDIATRCIDFYEDYYQTPYPLQHSYHVALPDFSAGAMENWGLVTYREACLLYDKNNSSHTYKQRVASVIAHELAHQWFGDLVTMKWWDNLWLNESFATMMEYVATDALEPSWRMWDTFQTSEASIALSRDATDGVQSVHVMVEDPREIDAIFDSAIVYAKGARLLVMVRALVGDDALRKGLKAYFDVHQYGNAQGEDLWDALEAASGFAVGQIMNSWLEQPGYPVINAYVKDGRLCLHQHQFFIGEHCDQARLWQIPLGSNYEQVPSLMTEETCDLGDYAQLRACAGTPFILNKHNTTHAIINYDTTLLSDILAHIKELGADEQFKLIQDMALLAKAELITYADLIPLLVKVSASTSHIVAHKLVEVCNTLEQFITPDSDEEALFKRYRNLLSKDRMQTLGVCPRRSESHDDMLSRPLYTSLALRADNQQIIEELHKLYETHHENLFDIQADIRLLVLKNEIQHFETPSLASALLGLYQTTTDALFKNDLRAAICASTDEKVIADVLRKFKDTDVIKPQDVRMWYYALLSNSHAEEPTWQWLQNEWSWLESTIGGDMEFTNFIKISADVFHTSARLQEFKVFFEPKQDVAGLGREIAMGITLITGKVKLIEASKPCVLQALRASVTG